MKKIRKQTDVMKSIQRLEIFRHQGISGGKVDVNILSSPPASHFSHYPSFPPPSQIYWYILSCSQQKIPQGRHLASSWCIHVSILEVTKQQVTNYRLLKNIWIIYSCILLNYLVKYSSSNYPRRRRCQLKKTEFFFFNNLQIDHFHENM